MTLADEIKIRVSNGEQLVALMDKKLGEGYTFNFLNNYKIIEVCEDELAGFCWIKQVDK